MMRKPKYCKTCETETERYENYKCKPCCARRDREYRANQKPPGRYQQSELLRQAAIDYIAKHPGAIAAEISKALEWTQAVTSGRLQAMCDDRELSRVEVQHPIINARGEKTVIRTFAYKTLVSKTKSAAKVSAKVASSLGDHAKPKADRTEAPKPKTEQITGRYVHKGGERTDLINSRGQGAIRPRVW